jgi:hypothetical protein
MFTPPVYFRWIATKWVDRVLYRVVRKWRRRSRLGSLVFHGPFQRDSKCVNAATQLWDAQMRGIDDGTGAVLGIWAPGNCLWGPRNILYMDITIHNILWAPDNMHGRPNRARRHRVYATERGRGVGRGAQDRVSPSFMGLASLGLEIGVFCDLLYSVLLLSVIDFGGVMS